MTLSLVTSAQECYQSKKDDKSKNEQTVVLLISESFEEKSCNFLLILNENKKTKKTVSNKAKFDIPDSHFALQLDASLKTCDISFASANYDSVLALICINCLSKQSLTYRT